MDMMQIRRNMMGVIAQMASGGLPLWKEITLDEDYTTGTNNQSFWKSFLGITDDPEADQNVYICIFENNSATGSYKISMAIYANTYCSILRNDYTSGAFITLNGTSYSMYAKSGTKIQIYRRKK